ncbi:DeoR/GlpR family DNA-binding transcription regulator [Phenylobacterium sp.]|jgi:DeoR family glycerol-3-phosphate regulon repressor|uniref:DeoR/GlpR family DNA-binding transcription regulator n=1 Tax=Phenylobacterium sp. TaxID=1871053 RepID=UPI002E332EAE|nr:DeoR/GlpR family DNA-binding transcription regulator [Phenylobacterium sp.]HEX2558813.1 DeoR/GlpR family DNA-binding transcription regulator [Phenylobacterium sp.]
MSAPVLRRHKEILEIARRTGRVTVEALAERLGVTPQTIRKDLNDLSANSLLSRVHGGAVITSGIDNLAYEARREVARDEKRAIGEAVAALIPDNASIFINIGTTTEEVARALAARRGLLVITNNLNVVDMLYRSPEIEVIVVGGRVRAVDRAAVGAFAVDFIKTFKVDFAVIGASAIDEDGALLDFDMNEVQVSQAIIQNARQVVLAADSSKLGRPAPVRIGHIGEVSVFVTDRLASPALHSVCESHGVRVVQTAG